MDWFSWLSRSGLDPSLIYEYGLAFARNELQAEDLAYFDHEFLQSMGISIAKHRLEILKLARKEAGGGPHSLSKFILAINKTGKNIKKCISKLVFHGDSAEFKAEQLEAELARSKGTVEKRGADKKVQEREGVDQTRAASNSSTQNQEAGKIWSSGCEDAGEFDACQQMLEAFWASGRESAGEIGVCL
ncbi:hypothetical protein OIU79_013016 [Salix purpurea]|uniref:SAM domain-containing protein n=1 Tax=Salix purpurea TaxID=77065 RepID=A0A9Q0Q529_SALPP|nr:hypothetical protein OIU79_013016 [Salix purpurea]